MLGLAVTPIPIAFNTEGFSFTKANVSIMLLKKCDDIIADRSIIENFDPSDIYLYVEL